MIKPQQIVLEHSNSWNELDIIQASKAFNVDLIEEIIELWKDGSLVRIADTLDYEYAYEDYIKSNTELSYITYFDFIKEIDKGYGASDISEIARLLVLSNGIYYDNCYC